MVLERLEEEEIHHEEVVALPLPVAYMTDSSDGDDDEEELRCRRPKRSCKPIQKFSHAFIRCYVCGRKFSDYDLAFSGFEYNVCSYKCLSKV